MNAYSNRYGLVLAAILVASFLAVTANAASSTFYVHVQQNISVETGVYYTIFAQAGNLTTSYSPSYPTEIWTYQWYNTTGAQVQKILGADSRTLSGVAGPIGSYSYEVVATNLQQGITLVNSSTLTVTATPSIALNANQVTLDQGQSYQFKSTYVPGAGNVSYAWNIGNLYQTANCLYPTNSTCTISTIYVAPGSYNVSLFVIDGTEHRYITAPVSARVTVNAMPNLTATVTNVVIGHNMTYHITVMNGTGPFNVYLYATNGTLINSGNIWIPGQTWTFTLPTPKSNSAYYAAASDQGVAGTYSFNSAVSNVTIRTPAGSTANALLIGVIVVLVMIALTTYAYNSGRRSVVRVSSPDDYEITPEPDDEAQEAAATNNSYETQSKLDSDEDEYAGSEKGSLKPAGKKASRSSKKK